MSEMVERVARAIAASDEPHEPWENWAERHKDTFRAEARAAIEAMREPTEGMDVAGCGVGPSGEMVDPVKVWRAMIDEALKTTA